MTTPVPVRETDAPNLEAAAVSAVLTAAEAAVAAYVLAAYTRWLAEVVAKVLAGFLRFGVGPDPGAIWSTTPVWDRLIDGLIDRLMPIARAGWMQASRQLGLDLPFDPDDPILIDQLQRTRNLMVRTPDEVYRLVVRALGDSIAMGGTVADQAQAVRHVLDVTGTENWPSRARTVAVTECLPGDALIDGAQLTAAYRRWYEGDWVTVITKQGHRISGTPNHPVLTTRGWIGLGELLEEDRLLRDHLQIDDTLVPLDPDVQTEPATIAEVFDAVKAVGVVGRVAGGKPDFHGDGLDGDIDVLIPDSFLSYGNFSQLCEHRVQLSLEAATLTQALLAAQGAPFSYSSTLEKEPGGPGGDAPTVQYSGDCGSAATESLRQALHAIAESVLRQDVASVDSVRHGSAWRDGSLPVSGDVGFVQDGVNGIHGDPQAASQDGYGGPGPVFLDDVVRISTSKFSGHVYNLSTVHGYFVAQGFFVGNTHRAFNMGSLAAAMRIQHDDLSPLNKRWVARDDSATRPGHARADGQIRPINQPFIVNMEPLMMPGDPSGSPSNVISCRCDVKFTRRTP